MAAIRNEEHEIIGYRLEHSHHIQVRDKDGGLVGWTAVGQTRKAPGAIAPFQENEGLLYLRPQGRDRAQTW